jgi:hypothetical protein
MVLTLLQFLASDIENDGRTFVDSETLADAASALLRASAQGVEIARSWNDGDHLRGDVHTGACMVGDRTGDRVEV